MSRYFSQLLSPTTVDAAVTPGGDEDEDEDEEGTIEVENKVLNALVAEQKGIHDSEAKRNISVVGQSR